MRWILDKYFGLMDLKLAVRNRPETCGLLIYGTCPTRMASAFQVMDPFKASGLLVLTHGCLAFRLSYARLFSIARNS